MHRVADGGVAPGGLGPVLLLGVLGVVDDQVGPVAQLEHRRVDLGAVVGSLVVAHEGHRGVPGLDAEAERGPDVGHLPDEHLGRSHGDHVVGHLVELDLALELFHLHREERGLHHPVDDVVEGTTVLGRAVDVHPAALAQQRRAEREADDVVPVQVGEEGRDLDGMAEAVALLERVPERAQAGAQVEDDRWLVADLDGHTGGVAAVAHVLLARARARAPHAEERDSQRTTPSPSVSLQQHPCDLAADAARSAGTEEGPVGATLLCVHATAGSNCQRHRVRVP